MAPAPLRGQHRNLDYTKLQERLSALSSNSSQFIAPSSGHSVELDEPEAVGRAIRWVRGRYFG